MEVADGRALILIAASCSSPQEKQLRGTDIRRTQVLFTLCWCRSMKWLPKENKSEYKCMTTLALPTIMPFFTFNHNGTMIIF